jgi:cystathionine beta-lyase/cystathionine gamma-synthase
LLPKVILNPKNQCLVLKLACIWGGYESLVFPGSILYSSMNNNKQIPYNLVRMYIGLEEAGVLINDLTQALEKV